MRRVAGWRIGGRDVSAPPSDKEIRDAVANEELSLVYQPEIDLLTRRIVALEALLRWQHPERGELGPESFVGLAERSGLIRSIGEWVVDTSIGALASWMTAIPELDVTLRVNISPVQINSTDLVGLFETTLYRYGVPGSRLCIELTEHEPLHHPTHVASTLQQLRQLGIRSAIDDLATGYSTLSQLRWLPVDVVKIDRSLVTGIDTDARAEAIVTALIGLAINFGMGVVAEGVETEEEIETLLRLGCTRAQGHLLGMPAPTGEVVRILRQRGNRAGQKN